MKKFLKIGLIILAVLLIIGAFIGYQVYKSVMGSEQIVGKLDKIPAPVKEIPPLTKGTSDWPNWRGAQLNGKSTLAGINKDWSKGLKKLWQVDYLCQGNATASWSALVIQGNRLIVPGRDDKSDMVFCLNADDGKLIWLGTYEAAAESAHGPGSRATPFIDNNRIYTFGRSGDLVCWDLESGKLLWRKNVKDIGGKEPQWGYSTSPFVYENKVIVQGGGNSLVVAYDKQTGDVVWKSMEGEAGYASAMIINNENSTKLIIYQGKGLSCLDPRDGKELWTAPWETKYCVNATTPLIENNCIFNSSGYEMGCQAIEVKNKGYKILWKNNVIEAQHSDPVFIDGYIYGYSGESSRNNGKFKCLELKTGKEIWSTGELGQGTTIFADGHLICLDIKGNLYLVKPDPGKFQKIGEIKNAIPDVTNPSWTVPVIANGKIYLRYMQHLICYALIP
jgi:outer membrane protein assembly factor BamB